MVRLLEVVQSEGKVRERERERDGGDGVGHSLVLQLLPQFPKGLQNHFIPFFMVVQMSLVLLPQFPWALQNHFTPLSAALVQVLAGYQALTRLSARLSITCQSVLDFFWYQVGRDMRQY